MGSYCSYRRPCRLFITGLALLTVMIGGSTGWGLEAEDSVKDLDQVVDWKVGTSVSNTVTDLTGFNGEVLTLLSNAPMDIHDLAYSIAITNSSGQTGTLNIGKAGNPGSPFGGINYVVDDAISLMGKAVAVDATTLDNRLDITYQGGDITVDVISTQPGISTDGYVNHVIGFAGAITVDNVARTFNIGDTDLNITAHITGSDIHDASGTTAGVYDISNSTGSRITSSANLVINDTRLHNSTTNADTSGGVYGLFSNGEVISHGTIDITKVSRTAKSSTDEASAVVYIYGVGSGRGIATANAAVTIGGAGELGISNSTEAYGEADASGYIGGVYGWTTATAQSVTIQNITSTAESVTGNALAGYSIYGARADTGSAIAHGAVSISELDFSATTEGTNKMARLGDADGLEIVAVMSLLGDATANADININNAILEAEALVAGSTALANTGFVGVFSVAGVAIANGAVKIGGAGNLGISSTATAAGDADASGYISGVYGRNGATAQSVTIQNITSTAGSKAGDATAGYSIIGVAALYNDAIAHGAVNISDLNFTATTEAAGKSALLGDIDYLGIIAVTAGDDEGDATAHADININNAILKAEALGDGSVAYANTYFAGVVSTYADATANGAVNIGGAGELGISSTATAAGDAHSSGSIYGVNGENAAKAQAVTIQNITSTADSKAGNAKAGYDTYGVYSNNGDANANGAVTISDLDFTATTDSDGVDAVANINTVVAGVNAVKGSATANGSVTIQNISIETEAPLSDSNADLRLFGVYAYGGDAKAGPASLTDINVASTGGTKANAWLDAVGIYGINGDATANGAITIGTSAMATLKGTNELYPVGAINASYGLRAQRGSMYEYEDNPLTPSSDPVWARAYGDGAINITAHSLVSRTGETTKNTVRLAQAVGIQAENILVDTLGSTTRKNITAAGDDYAFAIRAENMLEGESSHIVKFSPTITNLNGDIRLSANTSRPGNDFDRDDIAFILGPDVIKLLSPIAEAEYLAIGAEDLLNIALGAGVTSINGGHPYRLFGGEKINLNSGTLRLTYGAGASWVANQKEFLTDLNEAEPELNYGDVSEPARQTVFNLNSGATLAASGDMTPLLGYDQGVNTTLFTADGKFMAGRDYDLILNANDRSGLQLDYDPTLPLLQPDTALNDASPLPQVNGLRLTGTSNFAAGSLFHTTLVGGATQDPLADPNAAMLHVMGATNSKGESAYGVNIAKGAKLSLGFTAAAAQTLLDFRGESLRYYIISSEADRMLGTAGSWAPNANVQFDDDILGFSRIFTLKSQGIDNTSFDRDAYFLELGYNPDYEREDPRANTLAMMFWQPWRQPFQRLDENSRLARQRRALSDPCLNPCADPCAAGFTRGWNVWLSGYRHTGSVDADQNSFGYGFDRNAVFLGIDKTFADRFTLGLLGAYSNPGLKQSSGFVQSEITSDDYEVAVYAQYRFDWDLYLKAYAGYGRTHYDSRRELFDTGIHDLYQGSFSGDAFYASLELNRPFPVLPCFELTPVLALDYAKIWQDGFVESRSGFGARNGLDLRGYGAASDHRLNLRVGLDASFTPTERVTLTGRAQYYRLLSGSAAPDSVIYPEILPTSGIAARGADAGRDYVRLGLAGRVDLNTEKTIYLFGGYDYDHSSGSHTHSGQVGVGFMW